MILIGLLVTKKLDHEIMAQVTDREFKISRWQGILIFALCSACMFSRRSESMPLLVSFMALMTGVIFYSA